MVTLAKKGASKEDLQHEFRLMRAWVFEDEVVKKALTQFPIQFKERQG